MHQSEENMAFINASRVGLFKDNYFNLKKILVDRWLSKELDVGNWFMEGLKRKVLHKTSC